jgi:hypothetical protein
MYPIEQSAPSPAFVEAWRFAGRDLSAQGQGALNWVRDHLHPPLTDHLSFRIGNQIFCILINETGSGPCSVSRAEEDRLVAFCERHRLIACRYDLRRAPDGLHAKEGAGWNLVGLPGGCPINPVALVSDERILMSAWEIHDFGLQIVRRHLADNNCVVTSYQNMLDLDPGVWFEKEGHLHWCMVRTVTYPETAAARPANVAIIADSCRKLSPRGYFASVTLASIDDPFLGAQHALPLHRGHGVNARFTGLEPVTPDAPALKCSAP